MHIALLLDPDEAAANPANLSDTDPHRDLPVRLHRDVDLLNLRRVPTVLQKEVVCTVRQIHTADPFAADLFDGTVPSRWQKLNDERAAIL